ncbi:DUF1223 domain-containing protein [Paracoccus stylophorae]|uniref:DUF1223 domain-containing protein n=1 Tax=Paracoccus stylophorae TaxID=659350 RepID=A0ABY7SXV1_9RHOB|nr:DUF1223 domain-containing protein [Paracoccus stylophorae]WCR11756.1 DUF1223 domain-containing protein [Paracoccus stylophorae]
MLGLAEHRQGGHWCRAIAGAAAAALVGLLIAPGLAAADDAASGSEAAAAGTGAPVIAAPDDPGRAPPGLADIVRSESAGFNSFAPADAPLPPDSFSPSQLPVVVELFTSQGCSSCPPADAMLAGLAGAPGVLPLSYHVDYWDYLGWADSFAKPEFTRRQEDYARAAGERALYTPQLIVDGQDTAVAPGPAQLMALIDANRLSPAMLGVQRETTDKGEEIELTPLSDMEAEVGIVLVRYAPERKVKVTAGENRGRTVTYVNVVLAVDPVADWDGAKPLRLTIRPDGEADDSFPADARHVLLVQAERAGSDLPGRILAAIRLD